MPEDSVCIACGYYETACECSEEDLEKAFHIIAEGFGLKKERRPKMGEKSINMNTKSFVMETNLGYVCRDAPGFIVQDIDKATLFSGWEVLLYRESILDDLVKEHQTTIKIKATEV